ncbi:uncharacterized protein LACBIDRAFT_305503 [Laccaria bicolor S238N-H82]|uniref:Predicted protein n=1 Tax=Laccaria bicolor (strain S238N-H82 / ATCC MYA-4686) TaxID=486041 RepID=B0CUE4_LACBS|nr:uncharacterized protein LACBIDRAFT_305503 [Laccaria bicolor S238N-H82]EDR14078.1 predicted protein [Laccaria bicolor S238N-H82]|eukprot:XP_001874637.1 predicted protein [Laccaria bicolor S238N-H82]
MNIAPKVLIVGAGPSGLVLALNLLKNGVPVRVVEKEINPRIGQRGAGIMVSCLSLRIISMDSTCNPQPRSLELFQFLGVVDVITKAGTSIPTIRMYKSDGVEVLKEFQMTPSRDPTPTNPYLNPVLLGQEGLEAILRTALAEHGCSVELGTELRSFQQFDDRVDATLVKVGEPKGDVVTENATFDWVIGADGARGAVRKQLGLNFLGETRVEKFIVGDIVVEGLSPKVCRIQASAWTCLFILPSTALAYMGRCRKHSVRGRFSFVLVGENLQDVEVSSSHHALRKFLSDNIGNRADIVFGDIIWMSHYVPNIRVVDRFKVGRVFVAGDAAHVHSPTGGQGMNTSIQDSFNLGWKLALVVKSLARPSLLDTYSEERLPVVSEMLKQTTKLLNGVVKSSKDDGAWNRSGSTLQLGINYRWSSIILDEVKKTEPTAQDSVDERSDSYGVSVNDGLQAGDRAPDSPDLTRLRSDLIAKKSSLFRDVFGPSYHTVLIFAHLVDAKASLQRVTGYPKDVLRTAVIVPSQQAVPIDLPDHVNLVFEDSKGHAHEAYAGRKCGIIVVRPDGVVGAMARDPQWLDRYFKGILLEPLNF